MPAAMPCSAASSASSETLTPHLRSALAGQSELANGHMEAAQHECDVAKPDHESSHSRRSACGRGRVQRGSTSLPKNNEPLDRARIDFFDLAEGQRTSKILFAKRFHTASADGSLTTSVGRRPKAANLCRCEQTFTDEKVDH